MVVSVDGGGWRQRCCGTGLHKRAADFDASDSFFDLRICALRDFMSWAMLEAVQICCLVLVMHGLAEKQELSIA